MTNIKKYLIYIIAGLALVAMAVLASKAEFTIRDTRVPNTEATPVVEEPRRRPKSPLTYGGDSDFSSKPWREYCY